MLIIVDFTSAFTLSSIIMGWGISVEKFLGLKNDLKLAFSKPGLFFENTFFDSLNQCVNNQVMVAEAGGLEEFCT